MSQPPHLPGPIRYCLMNGRDIDFQTESIDVILLIARNASDAGQNPIIMTVKRTQPSRAIQHRFSEFVKAIASETDFLIAAPSPAARAAIAELGGKTS